MAMPEDDLKKKSEAIATPSSPSAKQDEDDATEADSAVAKSRLAVYVNSFLIETIADGHIFRMTFGEGTAGERDRIRSAIVMPTSDVKELVRILRTMLDAVEKEQSGEKTKPNGK